VKANERMRSAMAKFGFVVEGCQRQVSYKDKRVDAILYSILDVEWKNSVKQQAQLLCNKFNPTVAKL